MVITFLTEEQIFESGKSRIFDKIGTKAAMTDFSILLGGYVADSYFTNEGNELKHRTGWYWTKSDDGDNDARAVGTSGNSR